MRRFFKAIKRGNEDEVSRLLDANLALLEQKDSRECFPLVRAVHAGHLGMVKLLVQRGADVNQAWRMDMTPLHWAAQKGRTDMASYLLTQGAQAYIRDLRGQTPVRVAFEMGHLGVIRMLLEHMGEEGLQAKNELGWTPLMEAASVGDMCVVRSLVEGTGAQGLDAGDEGGRTALLWAAKEGHEEVVAFLLEKGAQANIGDYEGSTPLMSAAHRGHLGIVRLLLEHTGGEGLEETDEDGRTALMLAADGGHEAVVAFLLSQGAQASHEDDYGDTPCMLACRGGHLGVVQLLIQHTEGQGLDQTDGEGWTALHWAMIGGDAEVANPEVVALLLRNGAGASVRNTDGKTPLMMAGKEGQLGVLQIFLQQVGAQGLRERDAGGRTALHWAVRGDHEEVVRAFLLAGADPTIRDNRGRTPQALAEEDEDNECAGVFEWWEGELERRYLLQRSRCLHNAYTTHRDQPATPVPAFLQERAAAGHALPEVEVVAGQHEEQACASGKRKASSEGGTEQDSEGEEEQHAVVAYVMRQLNDQLFTELMQGFHAPGRSSEAVAGDDGSDAEEEDEEDEENEGSVGDFDSEEEHDEEGDEEEESEDEGNETEDE